MATPDTKFFTIPEASTVKVAKAVAQLIEVPAGRMVHIKNFGPWQPDAVRFPKLGILITRDYDHLEEGRYAPSNKYRVINEDGIIQVQQLTPEDITSKIKEQQRPLMGRIIKLPGFLASRNNHS